MDSKNHQPSLDKADMQKQQNHGGESSQNAEGLNEDYSSESPQRFRKPDADKAPSSRTKHRGKRRRTHMGKLPPPLPETIEFVQTTRPNNSKKRSASSDSISAIPDEASSRAEYHKEPSQEKPHLTRIPGNEFLMESLFMLLYLRRSTTIIPISIPLLDSTEHPILLTLASYPFRVLFSNDAHENLRGSADTTVGRTLFECFESDEDGMNPSLSSYPNFLKLILDGRPCFVNSRDREGHITAKVCTIKAEKVFSKRGEDEELQYYAIHFIVGT